MTILPLTYLGSVSYFAAVSRGDAVVDLGEHFVKRSERNRTRILGSDGIEELSVHVQRANHPRTPMRDVRIDYSKRWQHRHAGALVSAYAHAPYFDHYWDGLRPFYERRYEFLVDYNLALLETLCRALKIDMPRLSESYLHASPNDTDMRPKLLHVEQSAIQPYVQVFADRMAFVPNLSVVDLLFAEGPESSRHWL